METAAFYNKLNNYQGNNSFMNSLKRQLAEKDCLSFRQIECGISFFAKAEDTTKKVFTFKKEEKITIRKWLARNLADKLNLPFFFRNLIIQEVMDETARAIQVKVSFNSEIATCCHLCGRGLDNEVSKATGVGPVCAKKYLKVSRPTAQNAKEILDKIELEAKNAGVIGPIWIPKSQLVTQAQKSYME